MLTTRVLPVTGLRSAQIGMGCASLGSRVAPRAGLRALAAAHDAGLNWFDVAPSYGAGQAETLLGLFAKGRRDQIVICSKVGLAPPAHNDRLRMVYALGRPIAGAARGLRRRFRGFAATRNRRLELTPDLVRRALDQSLVRLGTDYLDVFALHDPLPADMRRDDIRAALHDLQAAGKARVISCAGGAEAIAAAKPDPFRILQRADLPGDAGTCAPSIDFDLVTHSVIGIGGAADRLSRAISADKTLRQRLSGICDEHVPHRIACNLLLRRAMARNPQGVVLLSLFGHGHLNEACSAVNAPPLSAEDLRAIHTACQNGPR